MVYIDYRGHKLSVDIHHYDFYGQEGFDKEEDSEDSGEPVHGVRIQSSAGDGNYA
jgi:hypothetical protein